MLRIFSQYVSRKTFFFLLIDALLMGASVVLAVYAWYWNEPGLLEFHTVQPDFSYQVAAVAGCFLLCSYYNELYNPLGLRISDYFFRLAQSLGIGCFVLAAVYFIAPSLRIGRGAFALSVALMLAALTIVRIVFDFVWRTAVSSDAVLILGVGRLAAELAREIEFRSDLNMRVVGFMRPDPEREDAAPKVFEQQVVGRLQDLEAVVQTYRINKIIVALEEQRGVLPIRELLRLRTRGLQVEDGNSALAALTGRIPLETVRSTWFIFSEGFRRTSYTMAIKRSLDLSLSIIGLIVTTPAVLATALAVRFDSPGPVLYRQRRVGLNGACFALLKFRTMRRDAEADGVARWSEQNDPRITRTGRFLRKYRFDELPQFFNVIRGEMSFVGPRPERPEFVERLREKIPYYDERHTLRPGITGWAQVCYPYGATVEDAFRKLEYDLFYLKNVSILFDLAIVFQTVKTVLWGRGR